MNLRTGLISLLITTIFSAPAYAARAYLLECEMIAYDFYIGVYQINNHYIQVKFSRYCPYSIDTDQLY